MPNPEMKNDKNDNDYSDIVAKFFVPLRKVGMGEFPDLTIFTETKNEGHDKHECSTCGNKVVAA